jgi:5-methylcytosine-specific restriction endonuclease McrA
MAELALGGFRQCSKCAQSKPWTFQYFRPYRNGGRSSLRATCRKCQGYLEGPERGTRVDGLSAEEKMNPNRSYVKRWQAKNPEKQRVIWRESAKRNKEQRRASAKIYRANNAEKVKSDYAAWREKNREHIRDYMRVYEKEWRENNRDKTREAVKRWRLKNPERAHHSTQLYWARKHGAEGSHTFEEKQAILKNQNHKCFYCGEHLTKYHADHFIPLSRGGTDYAENLRMACPNCNCRKSDKMPWEWMPERFSAP